MFMSKNQNKCKNLVLDEISNNQKQKKKPCKTKPAPQTGQHPICKLTMHSFFSNIRKIQFL